MIDSSTIYGWVRDLPIVDWHNHLDIRAIAEDRPLGSLYEAWVKPDPYKHRAMRICGVSEKYITGDAPDGEKMAAWNATLPKLVGNPLFAWSKMELDFLKAHPIETLTAQSVLKAFNVEYSSPCVTAAEIDKVAASCKGLAASPRIVPSLRLDYGDDVPSATLAKFEAAGCKVADVSLDRVDDIRSNPAALDGVAAFAAAHGWTMLLHTGAMRSTSSRLKSLAGPFGGFAGMASPCDPAPIARLLDSLEAKGALPRTILLPLNPQANAQLAVLSGAFVGDGVAGKVQLGPAWWWCDHKDGIFDVFEKSAAYSVLSVFIGMTTDSRSFLSFTRHAYFRRLLAEWVARKVADGDFPDDESLLRPLCEGICHRNAHDAFVEG